MEVQALQTNNQQSTPLGHRISAYQKLAPRQWSEPLCIVLSVLKDWGRQYQGMKLVHVSFFSIASCYFLQSYSNDFHSYVSSKRHHRGSQDRMSTMNSGSLVHQASAVTWQVWKRGDQWIWILNFAHWETPDRSVSRCHETCPNLLFFLVGWGKCLCLRHRRGILWWEAINLWQAEGDLGMLHCKGKCLVWRGWR